MSEVEARALDRFHELGISSMRIDRALDDLALLEAAAAHGLRCPTSHGPRAGSRVASTSITILVRGGFIRSEVFRHNYRVVTILTGPHAGKQTMPPPVRRGHPPPKPYMVDGVYVGKNPGAPGGRGGWKQRRIAP